MEKQMKINYKQVISKGIIILSYVFLALPFLIFVGGNCKWYIALPVELMAIISLVLAIKNTEEVWVPNIKKEVILKLIIIVGIITFWVLVGGIGRLMAQNYDHRWRNSIFEILVNYDWPIAIGMESGETRTLVYYIGFWLPSAIVGKILGLENGYNFQIFWSVLGIFLMYYFVCAWRKQVLIWPIFVIIFFGGMTFIEANIFGEFPLLTLERFWGLPAGYFFNSMTSQLYDVFNQTVPAWLTIMLLWHQKNNKNLLYIVSNAMLSATFPFVGMLPFIIYWLITKCKVNYSEDKNRFLQVKFALKEAITFQNVIGVGCIGIISFFYLISNVSSQKIGSTVVVNAVTENQLVVENVVNAMDRTIHYDNIGWIFVQLVLFFALETGIYFILLYKTEKENSLYWISLLVILLVPLINIGSGSDFCGKASVPALFILMLLVIDKLAEKSEKCDFYLLIAALSIGGVTAFQSMRRNIINTAENLHYEDIPYQNICSGSNFSGTMDSFFARNFYKEYRNKQFEELTVYYDKENYPEYFVTGATFSVEENSMVATELSIIFDGIVANDVLFEDGGMLDDSSVYYTLELNGIDMTILDYNNRSILIPKEYFTDYTQVLKIKINKEVKIYEIDSFKLSFFNN